MGAVESWITVTQRLGPTVRQRGNKNWNNLQDRHVCPPNCALTCKRLFWFAVRVCAVRYLCLSPYPWLTPSKCFGARSSPCPLVFPAMSHVTSPTFALLVCLLAPCICFCSFLFFAVSLRPGDGLPSPPHNTVGCAKVMMNHIPPTRCLKTKINTNADFHTPNHAVQHGAGFTTPNPPRFFFFWGGGYFVSGGLGVCFFVVLVGGLLTAHSTLWVLVWRLSRVQKVGRLKPWLQWHPSFFLILGRAWGRCPSWCVLESSGLCSSSLF